MGSNTNITLDANNPITALSSNTLNAISASSSNFNAAAVATGLTPAEIAAPIAREMNKLDSGDYSYGGFGSVIAAARDLVAVYGEAGVSGDIASPLTQSDYVSNEQYVQQNGITNVQSDGLAGMLNRLVNPVLNDVGIGKIQVGTAMDAVNFYLNNPQFFNGTDPLGLAQYANNTPQLVQDLINPDTTMATTISLQAVIGVQATQWGQSNIAGWNQLLESSRAAFITSYSTLGQAGWDKQLTTYLANGGTPGEFTPDLTATAGATGANYMLDPNPLNGAQSNIQSLENLFSSSNGSSDSGADSDSDSSDILEQYQNYGSLFTNSTPIIEQASSNTAAYSYLNNGTSTSDLTSVMTNDSGDDVTTYIQTINSQTISTSTSYIYSDSGDIVTNTTDFNTGSESETSQILQTEMPDGVLEDSVQVIVGSGTAPTTLEATTASGQQIAFNIGSPSTSSNDSFDIPILSTDDSGELVATVPESQSNTTYTITLQNQTDGTHLIFSMGNDTFDFTPSDQQTLEQGTDRAGTAGSYIGGQLALLLVTNSAVANLATSSFFSTAGNLIASQISSIPSNSLTATALASGFTQNFVVGAGGIAGNLLGSDLAAALGGSATIRAVGGVVGSTFGQAVFATAYDNLVPIINDDLGLTGSAALSTAGLSPSLLDNLESASSLTNLGVGLLDAVTGINILDPEGGNPENVAIGSSIGGLIGLFIPIPVINSLIGQFVGGLIGSLFGEPSVGPNVQAQLRLAISNNRFTASIGEDNNPPASLYQTVTEFGNALAATLNAEIDGLGQAPSTSNVAVGASNMVTLSFFENTGADNDVWGAYTSIGSPNPLTNSGDSNDTQRNFGTLMSSALSDAVIRELSLTTVSGADPGMTMALTNSLIAYDVNYSADALSYVPASETVNELNYDLQAESDYESYEANPIAFLIGYALRDPTNAAADWSAEFARASLLQSVTTYDPTFGNISINVSSPANQGGMGLLAYNFLIQPSNVSISKSGNNLVLSDSVALYLGAPLTTFTGSVTIQNAFSATQPIANLNGIIGQVQFYGYTYVSSYWTGIALAGLIAPNFTGSINLGAVQRDDGETAAPNYSANYSYFLLMNSGETVSISGLNADLAVLGSDAVVLTNTGDYAYLTNNDTLSDEAGSAFINIAGNAATVSLAGNNNTLIANGNSEVIGINDHSDIVTVNGQSNVLTVTGSSTGLTVNSVGLSAIGNGDTVTVDGIGNKLMVDGSGDAYYVNGASGNTIDLAATDNFVQTAASSVHFSDGIQGWVYGGNDTVTMNNYVQANISGDGFVVAETGAGDSATFNSNYSTLTVSGSYDQNLISGNYDTVTLAGQDNFLQVFGADSELTISGAGQDVHVSGGVVTVLANAQAVFDGTNHGGSTDFGNGNIFNVGSGASLIITGSNNWVQANSSDSITFEDQGDGVGATGGSNTISFQATGDYADINNSTLNVAAGLQAQLTGSGNYISTNSGSNVTITGSNNIGVSNGSGGVFSIAGTGNAFYINGGTVHLTNTAPAPGDTSQIKGFAFDSYSNGEFETPASAASLQALAATGANSVEMVVTQYTPTLTDPTIAPTNQTESDASLEQAIREAQSDGLSVLLKPQIDPSTGEYRALYNFSDPSQFFANYKTFIVHYAEIAQAMGVGMFSIGSELTSLTGPAYQSQWNNIIAAVRQVYSGQLTYASAYNETASVSFWSGLDVIGANPYEALTTTPNPTLAQLEAGWTTTPEADLDNLSPVAFYSDLSAAYQKPVLFTEVGYRSVDESNLLQGSNSATAPDGSYLYTDFQQQSTALQAFFDVYNQYGGSWLHGAYVWEWNPNAANVTPTDFSVQNKPALNVVEAGFNPTTAMASYGEANVTGYGDTVTLSAGDTVNLSGGSGNVTSQSGDRVAISNTYGNADTVYATNDLSNVAAADGLTAGIYVASNTEANVTGSNNSLTLGSDDSIAVSGGGNTINTQAGNSISISNTSTNGSMNADVVEGNNDQSGTYTEINRGTGISLSARSNLALNGNNDAVTGSGNNRVIVNGSNNVLNVGSGSYIEVQTGAQNVIFANGDNIVFDVQGSNAVIVGSNNKITGSYDYFGEYGSNNVTLGNFDAVNGSSSSDFTVGNNNSDYGSETSKSSFSGGSGGYYGYYGLAASKKSSSASGIDVVAQYDATQGFTQAAAAAQAAMEQAEQAAAGAFATSSDTLSQQPPTAFWADPTITWSFAPGPGTGASPFSAAIGAQEQPIIEEAIDTWEAASGLTFQQVSADAPADISIGWGDFDTADSGVLGYTTASHSGNSVLSSAVLRLEDPRETALTVDANGQFVYGETDVSLYQAALHEVGHALGLADNSDPNSVMYATLGPNNTMLDATDISAIQSLYGPEGTAAAFFSETPLLTVPQATQAALALSAAQSSLLPPTVLH